MAHQAPPSLGFSRQEHWSRLPFPSPMHESESEVAQLCLTCSDPMDCSPPGSSVHGIFPASILLLFFVFLYIIRTLFWRRQWHPTPVLLPGKSHGWRSLVGCSPWGHKESDTTERLHFHFHALEKEMTTHCSVLAWRIPGPGEPGGLPSMGSHRVRHD